MTLKIGIQGGRGSFNEEACISYCSKKGWSDYQIQYLYHSSRVLTYLNEGKIDLAQCALYNNYGGIVQETIHPLGQFNFKFIDEYRHSVVHHLMIHPNASLDNITAIMTHPQVFLQCKDTLAKKYPSLKQEVGDGDMIDSGYVAQCLSNGTLPVTYAVCGCKNLSTAHNLKIIDSNLQYNPTNLTSFIWLTHP